MAPPSPLAFHESGHALARYLIHGTTGPMALEPAPGKQAGVEAEPLPLDLLHPDSHRLVGGPYNPAQRSRLVEEVKTTLAGSVAEAMVTGESALDVLEHEEQASDRQQVYGIAGRLLPMTDERDRFVEDACVEVKTLLESHRSVLDALATAFEERRALSADEVAAVIGRAREGL